MDAGSHGGTQVGGATADVTEVIAVGKLQVFLENTEGFGLPAESCFDVPYRLHGDYAQMILLVDPDKKCFGAIVIDAPAVWPVPIQAGGLQETIALFEQKMICDQLLPG